MSPLPDLVELAGPLIDPATSTGEAYTILYRLQDLLDRHSPFRRHTAIGTGETWLDSGLALSPTQAAMCLQDVARTHAFCAGLYRAVCEARRARPNRPAHVLYAGSGPYALLALPTLAALGPEDVRVTLLDVHDECLASARTLLGALGVADRITAYLCEDATTSTIATDDPPDVIVTETMTACLEREPQVPIVRNLLGQAPGAVLVPRSVRVDVVLTDLAREQTFDPPNGQVCGEPDRDRIVLGTAFELSPESVESWAGLEGDTLPGGCIRFPEAPEPRYSPMMFTVIDVAEGIRLADYDSGLTLPRALPAGASGSERATVTFAYSLKSPPGIIQLHPSMDSRSVESLPRGSRQPAAP